MKQQITARTFTGHEIQVDKKAYRKAVKLCATMGFGTPIPKPSNEEQIKYLRAKQSAFNHALDRANLYSMRIQGRNAVVI